MGSFSDSFLKDNKNDNTGNSFANEFKITSNLRQQPEVQQIQQPVTTAPQQQNQNIFQQAGGAISGFFGGVQQKVGNFINDVSQRGGIGNVIADAIVPEDKAQPKEVQQQNYDALATNKNPILDSKVDEAGSLANQFWTSQVADALVNVQTAVENYKPIKPVDIAKNIENPVGNFVVSIPEEFINSIVNTATLRSPLSVGTQIGKDINTKEITDPKVLLADAGGVAIEILNASLVGGLATSVTKSAGLQLTKATTKDLSGELIKEATKNTGGWVKIIEAGKSGFKFGAGYGLAGGLEDNRYTVDNKQYVIDVALKTTLSGLFGFAFGATQSAIGMAINKAFNKLFISRIGAFSIKEDPYVLEKNIINAGWDKTPRGQKALEVIQQAKLENKDVVYQEYSLTQSPGGKVIGEDRIAKMFGVKNPAFTANVGKDLTTADFNGKLYRFGLVDKNAQSLISDIETPKIGEKKINTPTKPSEPKAPESKPPEPKAPKPTRKIIEPTGLPKEVTGSSISIRPDGTASYNIEISKESRGNGIGSEAVKKIEQTILDNNISKVVLPVKIESKGFFLKQGYQVAGEEKNGLITMTKDLTKLPTPEKKQPTEPKKPETNTDALIEEASKYKSAEGFEKLLKKEFKSRDWKLQAKSFLTTNGEFVGIGDKRDAHYNFLKGDNQKLIQYQESGGIRINKGDLNGNYPYIAIEISKTPTEKQLKALMNLPEDITFTYDLRGKGKSVSSDINTENKDSFIKKLQEYYPEIKSQLTDIWNQANKTTTPEKPKETKTVKETVTVYRGSNGVIKKYKKTYDNVLTVKTNQAELIKELANSGNKEAKALYESTINKEKVDFIKADKIIRNEYKGKYDAIKYENDTPKLKAQGVTYYELGNGHSYAISKDTAEAYALQDRGEKYKEKKITTTEDKQQEKITNTSYEIADQLLKRQIGNVYKIVEPTSGLWESKNNILYIRPERANVGFGSKLEQNPIVEKVQEAGGNNVYKVTIKKDLIARELSNSSSKKSVATKRKYKIVVNDGKGGIKKIEVDGKRIEIKPWIKTFIHKTPESNEIGYYGKWSVSELTTGLLIKGGNTQAEAIKYTEKALNDIGKTKALEIIKDRLERKLNFKNGETLNDMAQPSKNTNIVQSQLKNEILQKDVTLYHGFGGGHRPNETMVRGTYYTPKITDALKYARDGVKDVNVLVMKKGAKIFDLDTLKDINQTIVPNDVMFDPAKLTKYLIEKGYVATRNTNLGFEEVVKLDPRKNSKWFQPLIKENKNVSLVEDMQSIYKREQSFLNEQLKNETSSTNIPKDVSEAEYELGDYAKDLKAKFGDSWDMIKPIEMPELVSLVKNLSGKTPLIKKLSGQIRGKFKTKGKEIILRPELFEDPELANKVLAHELGHMIDYLPDNTMKRGNILGRLATLNEYRTTLLPESKGEPSALTKADRERLQKEARKLSKEEVTIEEIVTTGELPIEPKDVLAIWNDTTAGIKDPDLMSYISSLTGKQKAQILRSAMKNEIPKWVDYTKKITEKITRKVIKNSPQDIKDLYKKLVKEEIEKRRLYEQSVVMKELKELTQIWKPFDENIDPAFTKYRYSGKELYADALSVLFNRPSLLKQIAPSFYKAFFSYLDEKPEFAKNFTELQDLLNEEGDALYKRRDEELNRMYSEAESKFVAKELEKQQRKTSLWMDLRIMLDSKKAKVYSDVKSIKKQGFNIPDESNPAYLLEELEYLNSYIRNIIDENFQSIKAKVEQIPEGWTKLGKVLQLERAITERGTLANPAGFTPKTAQEQLDYMKRTMSQKEWEILQEGLQDFRKAQDKMNKRIEKAGYYSPELVEQMKANKNYATFQVVDYIDTYISPAVHKQVGTFKDVANPATSTVMKTVSILKAIERNTAKRATIDFVQEFFGDEIQQAPTKWNGRYHEVVDKKVPGKELVKIMRDGKLEGYYVDPHIAVALNRMNNQTLNVLGKVMRKISGSSIYRPLFTGINLGFQTYNLNKDFLRYWKNLPDKTLKDAILSFPKSIRSYSKAVKPSWDRATNKRNELINEMENLKILDLTFNDLNRGLDEEAQQINRVMQSLGIEQGKSTVPKVLMPIHKILENIEILGNFIETLPKVAGYQQLKGTMPEKELSSFIKTKLGSPNFREAGTLTPITNNMFLFSNAIKEGWKSDFRVATEPTTRSGYWFKTFWANIFPKLVMLGLAYGVFGEYYKRMMDNISEYYKTNYTTIPLGFDKNGKTIFIAVPNDETGRMIGGLVWKSLNIGNRPYFNVSDLAEVFSFYAGNIPSLAPNFTSMSAIMQYMAGQNPYDSFRGRNIIPDQEFKAGTKYSLPILANWLVQNSGGGIVIPNYVPQDTEMTNLQKILSIPVLSNIVGRWVKVTDYGQKEKLQDITSEVDKQKAQQSIEETRKVQNALDEYKKSDKSDAEYKRIRLQLVKDVLGTKEQYTGDDVAKIKQVIKKLDMAIIKGKSDPQINALISAQSNDAKAELLKSIFKDMDKNEIRKQTAELILQGIISKDVVEKYLILQEANK